MLDYRYMMGKNSLKIGLALGGGGSRSLAHLGVIKVFEEEKIPISLIVGCSMGAIVGGAYALSPDIYAVERKMLDFLKRKELFNLELFTAKSVYKGKYKTIEKILNFVKEFYLWNLRLREKSLFNIAGISNLINELIGERTFQEGKIPFAAVATDLNKGEEIIINQGSVNKALIASSALPGIFPPLELNGRILVDGGVVSQVPVEATFKLGANMVIAVDVERGLSQKEFTHGIDILFQTDAIRAYQLNQRELSSADFVIKPHLQEIHWSSFSKGEKCILQGEIAARNIISSLKKLIVKERVKKWLGLKRK